MLILIDKLVSLALQYTILSYTNYIYHDLGSLAFLHNFIGRDFRSLTLAQYFTSRSCLTTSEFHLTRARDHDSQIDEHMYFAAIMGDFIAIACSTEICAPSTQARQKNPHCMSLVTAALRK